MRRQRNAPKSIKIEVTIKKATSKAILIDDVGTWLPKSQIKIISEGDRKIVRLPAWLAVEKGLV